MHSLPPNAFRPSTDSLQKLKLPMAQHQDIEAAALARREEHQVPERTLTLRDEVIQPGDLWVKLSLTVCAAPAPPSPAPRERMHHARSRRAVRQLCALSG